MLPNTFLIGAQKSGTTFLSRLLMQHPDICFSKKKELHFFSKKHNRKKGMEYYESQFEPFNGEKVVMEGTPGYIMYEHVLKDIRETIGKDIKLLVIIREPIKRLISQYKMRFTAMGERRQLDEAVSFFLKTDRSIFKNYVNRGLYYDQLKNVEKYFPKENIHITVFEDFIKDPQEKIKDILGFLGVDKSYVFDLSVGRNPGRNTMPNIWGSFFFSLPGRIKGKYLKSLTFDEKMIFFDKIMSKSRGVKCGEISDENMSKLIKLYRPQIEMLKKEYKLDLSSWDTVYNDTEK